MYVSDSIVCSSLTLVVFALGFSEHFFAVCDWKWTFAFSGE